MRDDPPAYARATASDRAPDRPHASGGESAPSKSDIEPPSGAAGFEFGAKPGDARGTCTGAGFEWSALGGAKFRCSGVPKGVDLAGARAELWFCRGTLCGIFISGHPPEGDTWSSTASGLYEALIGKYGQPSQRDLRIPAHCGRTDGAASAPAGPDCIESGHASLRATWTWPTARRIEVFVGIPDGAREPSVELSYTSPRVDTGAEGL